MFTKKRKRRSASEVSAGSMADIAFLLLIFFLVTTTIVEDKGLLVKLPPWETGEPPKPPKKNVLSVKINASNELLVNGQISNLDQLHEQMKRFVANPEKSDQLPSSPKRAIISLQNDRATTYEQYVNVYNTLKKGYRELREAYAMKTKGKALADLTIKEKNLINQEIPMVISETEPTDFKK